MEATTEKDIGVTFDGQLSFDEHINSKVKNSKHHSRSNQEILQVCISKNVETFTKKHIDLIKGEKYNKIPAGETFLMMYVPVLCVICLFHFLYWRAPCLALLL